MGGILGRVVYASLLLAVLVAAAWISFSRFVLGKSMTVPDLRGLTADEAAAAVAGFGLSVVVDPTQAAHDEKVPARRVRGQIPTPETAVKAGQRVRLFLSLGPRTLRAPQLAGLTPRTAALALRKEGLVMGVVSSAILPGPTGITSQGVEPGTLATESVPVDVLVNRNVPDLSWVMPDLIGRDFEKVRLAFEARGFRLGGVRSQPYEGAAAGTILRQHPLAGYAVSQKETISFVVAAPESPL